MSDISNQLIKDSYNYVLQSDTTTGLVYRIGGTIPVNPTFQSGLTVTGGFTYSGAGEQVGYVMTCDALGNATWAPASAATPSSGVTSITANSGLSGDVTTGAVTIINTDKGSSQSIFKNIQIDGQTQFSAISNNDNLNFSGINISIVSASTNTIVLSALTDQVITLNNGTGISVTGTYPVFTITNTLPDKTVTLSAGTNIAISGKYPDFGISVTGLTSTSGDYLPLSGGTVTGGTIFQSGLTANTFYSSGQVGIGTSNPNVSAIVEIASTSQGVLFPRMTIAQRNAITSTPVGLILFVTDGDNEGLYIYKTSGWVQII